MKKIVSPHNMALLDQNTIQNGTTGEKLMALAGNACAEIIIASTAMLDRITVFCGSGNNGGDGFVIARLLSERGNPIKVVCFGDMTQCSPESKKYYDALSECENEIEVIHICSLDEVDMLKSTIEWGRVYVDCLFGNGLKNRPLPELFVQTINRINEQKKPVFAIDIPSGLSGDTGMIVGAAIKARTTIAIQFIKQGCLLEDGPGICGEIETVDIGISDDTAISDPHFLLEHGDFKWPQPRKSNSHKYQYGVVTSVAGSKGMFGAGVMCAQAAIKSGCGLVTAVVPEECFDVFAIKMPNEIMLRPYTGELTGDVLSALKSSAVIFGPGVGRKQDYGQFLKDILEGELPVLIDADGLWHLKQHFELLEQHNAPLILTPHFGEFCHLADITPDELKADIIGIGKDFAKKYHCTLVLKGHRTLIFAKTGEVYFNSTGNPGMATAGSGDVLSGLIAGIVAQGFEPVEAAKAGVYYHGLSGDTYAGRFNESTLTATDIIEFLKVVLNY